MYEMGARTTIAEVAYQIFASVPALTLDTTTYMNGFDWVQASFNKVVRSNHPSLYFLEGTIQTSQS